MLMAAAPPEATAVTLSTTSEGAVPSSTSVGGSSEVPPRDFPVVLGARVHVCALSEVWSDSSVSDSMRAKIQNLFGATAGAVPAVPGFGKTEPHFRGGDKLEKLHGMFPAKLRVYSQRFNDKVRFLWVARKQVG